MSEKFIVDCEFGEKFFKLVDSFLEYGVYFFFYEFWEKVF